MLNRERRKNENFAGNTEGESEPRLDMDEKALELGWDGGGG